MYIQGQLQPATPLLAATHKPGTQPTETTAHCLKVQIVWECQKARKFLLIAMCMTLCSCTQPLSRNKPLDVSRANQCATESFSVSRAWTYKFSLAFVRPSTLEQLKFFDEILGGVTQPGIPIPIQIQIKQRGKAILNEYIHSVGTCCGISLQLDNQRASAAVRSVKVAFLKPGEYSVSLCTLNDNDIFQDVITYALFDYHNPKF